MKNVRDGVCHALRHGVVNLKSSLLALYDGGEEEEKEEEDTNDDNDNSHV